MDSISGAFQQKQKPKLRYRVKQFQPLLAACHAISENDIMGAWDSVPGLVPRKLPAPASSTCHGRFLHLFVR